jgi:hypothetical protein
VREGNQLGVATTCIERQPNNSLKDAACDPSAKNRHWHIVEGDSLRSGWVYDSLGMLRTKSNECLTDANPGVQVRACDSQNPAQRWVRDAGAATIRSALAGSACLTRSGQAVALRDCTGSADQHWSMPERVSPPGGDYEGPAFGYYEGPAFG